jgi:hypothetical protein
MKGASMWRTKSVKMMDFLAENGVHPKYTKGGAAYYKRTKELQDLILRFTIIHVFIPNRSY